MTSGILPDPDREQSWALTEDRARVRGRGGGCASDWVAGGNRLPRVGSGHLLANGPVRAMPPGPPAGEWPRFWCHCTGPPAGARPDRAVPRGHLRPKGPWFGPQQGSICRRWANPKSAAIDCRAAVRTICWRMAWFAPCRRGAWPSWYLPASGLIRASEWARTPAGPGGATQGPCATNGRIRATVRGRVASAGRGMAVTGSLDPAVAGCG